MANRGPSELQIAVKEVMDLAGMTNYLIINEDGVLCDMPLATASSDTTHAQPSAQTNHCQTKRIVSTKFLCWYCFRYSPKVDWLDRPR